MAEVMHVKDMSNLTLQSYYNQVTQRLVDAERNWARVEMDTGAKHSALRDEWLFKIEALRGEVLHLNAMLKQQQQKAEANQQANINTITKGMAQQAMTAVMLKDSKREVAELTAKVEDMKAQAAAREEAAAAGEKELAIQVARLMAENDKLKAAAQVVTEGSKGLKACGGDGKGDIIIINTTTTTTMQEEQEEEAAPPAISTAKPSPAAAAAAAEAPSTPVLGESCGAAGGASKVPSAAAVKAAQGASLAVSGLIRRPSSGGSSGRSSPSAAPSPTYSNTTSDYTTTKTTNSSNNKNKGGRRCSSSGKSKNHSGRPNHNYNHTNYGSGYSQGMGAGYQGGRHSSGGGSYGSFNSNTSSGGGGGCYRGYEGANARGSHSCTEGYTASHTNRCHSHPRSNYSSTNKGQRGGYGHKTTGRRSGPSGGAYSSAYSNYY